MLKFDGVGDGTCKQAFTIYGILHINIEDRKRFSALSGVYIPEAVVERQMAASPAPPSPPVTASTPASRKRRSLQRSLLSVAADALARAVTSPPGGYSPLI